ncbi:uncharacterized protein [Ptychodera flava]|uniref:uncharacterized protein n=1 Tax=Ptychodera flava TaxID=63121 RepID=UPI00396A5CAC
MNVAGERPYWTRKRQKNANNEYECQYCKKICPNELYLRQHEWMHEGLKPLKCNMCDRSFCWYSTLTAHKRTHRKKGIQMTPVMSSASLPSSQALTVATRPPSISAPLHASLGQTKSKEEMQADSPASLMRSREYRECERVRCPHCDRHFSTPSGLKYHLRTHVGLKPFTCEICGRLLSSKQGLDYHLRVHSGERPYRCGMCDSSFRNQTLLNAHYSRKHPQIRDVPVFFPVSPTTASTPETSPTITTESALISQHGQGPIITEASPGNLSGWGEDFTSLSFATLPQAVKTSCNLVIPLYPFSVPIKTEPLLVDQSQYQINPGFRALDLSNKIEMEGCQEEEMTHGKMDSEVGDVTNTEQEDETSIGEKEHDVPSVSHSSPIPQRKDQEAAGINESPWQQSLKRNGLPSNRDTKRAKLEATIKGIKGKVTGEKKVQTRERDEESHHGDEDCLLPKILNVYSLRRDQGNSVPSEGKAVGSEGKGQEEKVEDVTVSSTSMLQEGDLKKQSLENNPDFEDLRRLADDEMSVMQNLVEEYVTQTNKEEEGKDPTEGEYRVGSGRHDGKESENAGDSVYQDGEEHDCEIDSSMQPDGIPKSASISTQTSERNRGANPASDQATEAKTDAYSAEDESLQCKHCDIQFMDSVQHTLHGSWHHSEAEPFKCKGCLMDCGQRDKFFCHVTRMATSEHLPEVNSDATGSRVNTLRPSKNVGGGFECTYCGWKFSDVVLYTLHTSWHQNSEVPFYCKGCKTAYSSQEDLVCHITRIIISPH